MDSIWYCQIFSGYEGFSVLMDEVWKCLLMSAGFIYVYMLYAYMSCRTMNGNIFNFDYFSKHLRKKRTKIPGVKHEI